MKRELELPLDDTVIVALPITNVRRKMHKKTQYEFISTRPCYLFCLFANCSLVNVSVV